jgi:hypothetical protein
MQFKEFKALFQEHFDSMSSESVLFVTDVDHEQLWELYLDSFPEGVNGIYRERRAFDCSCCRHFIKKFGDVVAIVDNELVSVWDFEADEVYQPVIDALSEYVKSNPVANTFASKLAKIGTNANREMLESGDVHTWHHFYVELPDHLVVPDHQTASEFQATIRDSRHVFERSLEEIDPYAIETILDLIEEGNLYKGEEWRGLLSRFRVLQHEYSELPENQKTNFCWKQAAEAGGALTRLRNHSIGVLLADISDGKDVIESVRRYENIVAPHNYKRPKAIYTRKMVDEAEEDAERLGVTSALPRRFAHLRDVTVNDVLFADRDAMPHMAGSGGVFDVLRDEETVNPRKFRDVAAVGAQEFIDNVIPESAKIEVLLENRHAANLVSLIAPQATDSKPLTKWSNGFTWAYSGNMADSDMKRRVKAAGGNVKGVLRFSLQWNEEFDNRNDYDAHCIEPDGNHIYFPNKRQTHPSSGVLDVDIIHPKVRQVAVENITWSDPSLMQPGVYKLFVKNYQHRGGRSGFSAEIEYNGQVFEFEYRKDIPHKGQVLVAKIEFDRQRGIRFIKSLPTSDSSREVWGLDTNRFHRVSLVCYSPNYWGDNHIGHRHYLFMIPGTKNDERPSGFFNEYLPEELMKHKRIFAALGNKMRVEDDDEQLSGVGFSATRDNYIVARINGNRIVKVVFN